MSLSLPIYLRDRVYVLHTRINGVQFKRSLYTHEPAVAKPRGFAVLFKTRLRVSGHGKGLLLHGPVICPG